MKQAHFGGTPVLTLVPGKSPCAPPQIVVNHTPGNAHSPNTQQPLPSPSQSSSQQQQPSSTLTSAQPLASPGHINLLQPMSVVTGPLQQFIVPGLVMATDGSGNTTLIQDPVGSLANIQNIPNVQTISNLQNMQNVGVQLQVMQESILHSISFAFLFCYIFKPFYFFLSVSECEWAECLNACPDTCSSSRCTWFSIPTQHSRWYT